MYIVPPSLLRTFIIREAKPRPARVGRIDGSRLPSYEGAWDAWLLDFGEDEQRAREAVSLWDFAAGSDDVVVGRKRGSSGSRDDIAYLPSLGQWVLVSYAVRVERKVDPGELDGMQAALDALGKPEKAR